jgi:aconitate hydratase
MQDATAQMRIASIMNAGKSKTAVPSTVHCVHLIQASKNGLTVLQDAIKTNKEVYDFLESVPNKYESGSGNPARGLFIRSCWRNYAFQRYDDRYRLAHRKCRRSGEDCYWRRRRDAVDVMAGMAWELKFPKLFGIKLTGKLNVGQPPMTLS